MDNKNKERLFALLCVAGFVLIPFAVPKIGGIIASGLGFKLGRGVTLLIVAFFFYVWGEVCLYIKNKNDIK